MHIAVTHLITLIVLLYIIYICSCRNIYITFSVSFVIAYLLAIYTEKRFNPRLSNYYGMYNPVTNDCSSGFVITKIYNEDASKNILVTSLYGNDKKYYQNIDSTLNTITQLGDDWRYRIYLHDKVEPDIRDSLIEKGIQVYIVSDPLANGGMNSAGAFWRFMPLKENIRFIVIDADDDLDTQSLQTTIANWTTSGKPFMRHVLPLFLFPKEHVSAGMWGGFGCGTIGCGNDLQNYKSRIPFGSDEIYTNTSVLRFMKSHGCISFFSPISTACHIFRHPLITTDKTNNINMFIPTTYNKL
jgi:hypothetical protein